MLLIDFGVMSVQDLTNGRLQGATAHRAELSALRVPRERWSPLEAFVVVIIDEAQNLSLSLIEEIRILSDLHRRAMPLQVLFVGQLELRAKLKLPEMRQVDQRVALHCSLEPMHPRGAGRLRGASPARGRRRARPGALPARRARRGVRSVRRRAAPDQPDLRSDDVSGLPGEDQHVPPCDGRRRHPRSRRRGAAGCARGAGRRARAGRYARGRARAGRGARGAPATGRRLAQDRGSGTGLAGVRTSMSSSRSSRWSSGPSPRRLRASLGCSDRRPPAAGAGGCRRHSLASLVPAELTRRRLGTAAAAIVGVTVSGLSLGMPGLRNALDASVLPVPAAPVVVVAPAVATAMPALSPLQLVTAGRSPRPPLRAVRRSRMPVPRAAAVGEVAATTLEAPASADTALQGYVLEVALFGSASRAARLVEELAAAGFRAFEQPLGLGLRGSFRQVMVGPFATREEADRGAGATAPARRPQRCARCGAGRVAASARRPSR